MTTNSSIALITGGTSGIGRAAANKLAQLGIHVLVVGRNAHDPSPRSPRAYRKLSKRIENDRLGAVASAGYIDTDG